LLNSTSGISGISVLKILELRSFRIFLVTTANYLLYPSNLGVESAL
jgi:hypothetical protein